MLRVLDHDGTPRPAFVPADAAAVAALVAADRPFLWIDLAAAERDEVAALATVLDWHPLLAEDVEHRGQRQKVEQFGGTAFAVLRVPAGHAADGFAELHAVQSARVLVTAHDGLDAWIDEAGATVARRRDLAAHGAAGAVAALLALVADAYEAVLDELAEPVDRQEAAAFSADGDPMLGLRRAAAARAGLATVRRNCGTLREVVGVFVRRELLDDVHSPELDLELRDVLDHVVRAWDELELLHDRLLSLADVRLALVAYRQNEITKRLSAWAAVLLVPTIVTGWFGQNFRHMVGIDWAYGELLSLAVMAVLAGGGWVALRRARWL